jgi:type I restriction enzyme S subunit
MSDYKKSNNTIPKHWRWVTLGELAIVGPNNGVFKRRQDFGRGVRLVNVADLYKSLKLNISNLERVQVTDSELKKYEVLKGDLFFCRSSLKREGIGWCCYAGEITEPTVYECHVMRIRPNPEIADSKFIAYYWQHPDVRNEIITKAKTATMTTMNQSDLSKVIIPLPPLPEQKRIAEVLDKADTLREKRRLALQKLDTLLQSVFLEMFGDPVKNPKGWERTTIRDLVSSVNYGTSEKAGQDGEYPILRMNNITYQGGWNFTDLKYIDLSEKDKKKYLVKKGDILFNRTNSKELVGKTAVYRKNDEMAIAGYLIRVRTNEGNNPEYISAFLNSRYGKLILNNMCKNIIGMANINAQELQDIAILKPPTELQNQFASIVEQIERTKAKLQSNLLSVENLFQSLQQRAFKGELFSDASRTVKSQEV